VFITLKNTGDLPTFISKGLLIINGKTEELYFFSEDLEPGKEKTISTPVYIYDLPKTFSATLKLYNDKDEEVVSYSFQATL